MLTRLSDLSLLKGLPDPRWLDHVDPMLEGGEVLRELDVRGYDVRDFV
jgi:hypothetical protein